MTPYEEKAMTNKLSELAERIVNLQTENQTLNRIVDIQEQTINTMTRSIESLESTKDILESIADIYKGRVLRLQGDLSDKEKEIDNLLYEITDLMMKLSKKRWWQFWK